MEELNQKAISRDEIREYLNPVYDLERLVSKISYQTANPRDLIAFKSSLSMLPHIRSLLAEFESPLLARLYRQLDDLNDLYQLLESCHPGGAAPGYEGRRHHQGWLS